MLFLLQLPLLPNTPLPNQPKEVEVAALITGESVLTGVESVRINVKTVAIVRYGLKMVHFPLSNAFPAGVTAMRTRMDAALLVPVWRKANGIPNACRDQSSSLIIKLELFLQGFRDFRSIVILKRQSDRSSEQKIRNTSAFEPSHLDTEMLVTLPRNIFTSLTQSR